MVRAILGVIVGYVVWTAVWLGGNAALFAGAQEAVARGEAIAGAWPLLGVLGLSVVCSVLAGVVCARICSARGMGPAIVLAVLLLLTGIGVQARIWKLEPVWYHAAFLVLLVPVTLAGAKVSARRRTAGAIHA